MITIMSYVSNNLLMYDDYSYMPVEFMAEILNATENENILIGRKSWEYLWEGNLLPNRQIYVLSRKNKRYKGVKVIHEPSEFPGGVVLGGRSTISSMMPFAKEIVLGVSRKEAFRGLKFPRMNGFNSAEVILFDNFDLMTYMRK